jgi:molecular chaperone GrpE
MLKKIEDDVIRLIREIAFLKGEVELKEKDHHEQLKKLLLSILDVLDDFDRKFINIGSKLQEADEQTKIWISYFRSTRKLLGIVIREWGVAEIDTIGLKAIPGYHFTVDVVQKKGMEEEIIIEELKKGYFWKTEVLRKAEVITVKNN